MAFGPEFITGLSRALKNLMPFRISKIEGGETWAALKIFDYWLLFSWTSGASGCCFASQNEISALKNISSGRAPMAEVLKSRLLKGEIFDVKQINNDRVLEFQAKRRISAGLSVNYFLILEATEPVGNFIILNSERKIDEAVRHSTPDQNSYRTILPGHAYNPPPAFNGIDLNNNFLNFEDVQDLKGIGRPLAKLIQSNWEKENNFFWFSAVSKALSSDLNLNNNIDLKCQIIKKNNYLTCFDFIFPEAEFLGNNIIDASKYGVIIPLLNKARDKKLHEIDAQLKRSIKSRERHRDGLLKQLKECQAADIFKKKGEAILANIYKIKPYSSEIDLTDWEGNILKISLDPNLSPSRNAEKYFKKYRKAKGNPDEIKKNLDSIVQAIKELKEQHDLLASINNPSDFEKAAKDLSEWLNPEDLNSKNQKSKNKKSLNEVPPHAVFEKEGITILAGLSARGNRYVTFKMARPDDIWLHAHEVPGAHVIIKNIKRSELENEKSEILKFAASIAAGHSGAKSSGSVLVDYTERKYVRSVPGTTALVTYTNPGTVKVIPNENI